jgi:hypothetical protein
MSRVTVGNEKEAFPKFRTTNRVGKGKTRKRRECTRMMTSAYKIFGS